jgi:rare lipoprotein A (peptidoglycan hydrolase)
LRDKLLNKWLLVQDAKTGKTVRVWANDVGPLVGDSRTTGARHLDLSSAAFTKLFGSTGQGLGRIKYKVDPSQKGRP